MTHKKHMEVGALTTINNTWKEGITMTMEKDYVLYFDDAEDAGTETDTGNNGGDNGSNDDNNGASQKGNNNNTDNDKNKPKYTDADLDAILNKKFAKWQKQQKQAVDEATRLANMTAQERAEHERDKLQKELDALKKANTIAEMEKTARNMLHTDGVTVPDEIVSVLVGDDAETTNKSVKAFSKAFKDAVQKEVKRQLTHKSPSVGRGAGTITKADIEKEPDPIKRQKLIRENMSLFRK